MRQSNARLYAAPLDRTMATIAEGVEFDTIAREWRCKWSEDSDKAALVNAQAELNKILADVKAVDGVKSVQRIVCGGCHDFKVITSLTSDKFGIWEEKKFAPEEAFLAKLKEIDGISEGELVASVASVSFFRVSLMVSHALLQSRHRPTQSCPCRQTLVSRLLTA